MFVGRTRPLRFGALISDAIGPIARLVTASLLGTALLMGGTARAADAPSQHPPPPAPLPAPPLTLTVDAATDAGPWRLRIENTGDLPVRVAADPRLLILDVVPPPGTLPAPKKGQKAPGPVQCKLPDDARPAADEGAELVIPGKRSWSAKFDPFFYCFGGRERASLVKDAVVTAHFGWIPKATKSKKPSAPTPPFAAAPVGAATRELAPAKVLDASPTTLTSTPQLLPKTEADKKPPEDAPPTKPLALTMPATLDVARGTDLPTTVTVQNQADRKATVLFRSSTLGFNVNGPAGAVRCGETREIDSPIRELFTTLAPKGKASVALLLGAVCPTETFDAPGIYRVTPRLDTTGTSGRSLGMTTWDDVAEGTTPMLVRVRAPRRPPAEPTRPTLD